MASPGGTIARAIRIALLILLLHPQFARAQAIESSDVPNLPAGIPALPPPGDGNGLIVSSANAGIYKPIIVPELYELAHAGVLEMEVFSRLRYAWRYDDEWEKNSAGDDGKILLANGMLTDSAIFKRGFIFGSSANLALEKDAKVLGRKIAWNAASVLAGQRNLLLDFEMLWLKENNVRRKMKGTLVREYMSFGGKEKQGQFFHELLRFSYPQPVAGLSWLTFRFLGSAEDVLWVYSLANQKAREITGSNRSDGMVTSSISLDDILVWSGKPELTAPLAETKTVALVPFPAGDIVRASAGRTDGCDEVAFATATPGGGRARWNFEDRRFHNGAGWLPAHALYVPRELWRVELASQDPYALYGRQVLYVDAAAQLPLLKFVYDGAGNHWKSVIGIFGLAFARENTRKVPINAAVIVLDHIIDEAFIFDVQKMSLCDSSPEPPESFDPRKLGPPSGAQPTPGAGAS